MDQRLALAYGVAGLSAAIAIVTVFSTLATSPSRSTEPTPLDPPALVEPAAIVFDAGAEPEREAAWHEGRERHERHERGEREDDEEWEHD